MGQLGSPALSLPMHDTTLAQHGLETWYYPLSFLSMSIQNLDFF